MSSIRGRNLPPCLTPRGLKVNAREIMWLTIDCAYSGRNNKEANATCFPGACVVKIGGEPKKCNKKTKQEGSAQVGTVG
jgi:hypothetical protein